MNFDPEQPKTPSSIGDISVTLTDYISGEETDSVDYEVQVLQEDGSMFTLAKGDLVPRLTPAQITQLQSFMSGVRTLAQGLLP